jgi:hypothetical protein
VRGLAALTLATALGITATTALALPAQADDGARCGRFGACSARATQPAKPKKVTVKPGRSGQNSFTSQTVQTAPGTATSGGDRGEQAAAAKLSALDIAKQVAAYKNDMLVYQRCVSAQQVFGASAPTCDQPATPNTTAPQLATGEQATEAPPVPVITPEEAAYMALAQLQLPTVAPGIGPDPDKNEWKMAAVGFPLWLWADGDTQVGPVTENVANLSVSLDARISKMVFQMGDGKTVTCAGAGTPYGYWVKPGTKSPTCGYTYDKPSLPRGKYTVSTVAYWDVAWEVNGATGVITMPRPSSAQLPVGELQAVVVG